MHKVAGGHFPGFVVGQNLCASGSVQAIPFCQARGDQLVQTGRNHFEIIAALFRRDFHQLPHVPAKFQHGQAAFPLVRRHGGIGLDFLAQHGLFFGGIGLKSGVALGVGHLKPITEILDGRWRQGRHPHRLRRLRTVYPCGCELENPCEKN